MLDFVPFASSRREMANGNREFELVCQLLKLDLPQAHAVPIAATAVGRDHQTFGFGVALPPHRRPPNVHDFIDPKLRRAVPYGVYDIKLHSRPLFLKLPTNSLRLVSTEMTG